MHPEVDVLRAGDDGVDEDEAVGAELLVVADQEALHDGTEPDVGKKFAFVRCIKRISYVQ